MSKVKNLNLEKVKETIKLNPSASYSEFAKVLDCSKSTIYYFIQKHNITHHKYYSVDKKTKAEFTDTLSEIIVEKDLEIVTLKDEITLLKNTINDLEFKNSGPWYKKIINIFKNNK